MAAHSRIVSVLFVDLVASTALSVRLGDDATDRMRRRYFATLREAISLNRGEEISSAGDGMLAAFEGSAVDAVGCAIAMQRGVAALNLQEPGLELSIRVGISVGEVAREDGEWHGMPLVEGARLESAAQPDQILVADLVRLLAGSRGGYEFVAVGALELKGLAEPLSASEVLWEPSPAVPIVPLPAALQTADRAPLLGRGDELAQIRRGWNEALDGATLGIGVTGDPGIGKSHLAASFAASLRGEDAIVLYGQCGSGERCEPIAQAIRSFVAAANSDQAERATGAFSETLGALVPLLRQKLPDISQRENPSDTEVAAGVCAFLANVSVFAPVLLVLDDLEGADAETVHLIDRLLATQSPARLLVLALSRDAVALPNAKAEALPVGPLELASVERLVLHVASRDDALSLAGDLGDVGGNPRAAVDLAERLSEAPAEPLQSESASAAIIGRSEPRRRIGAAIAASATGRRSALLVSGEAGMGKTTLVQAAIEEEAGDALIGWGTCWHGEGAPAFWPWTQALDDLARAVGPESATTAAGNDLDTLAVLIRDLGRTSEVHGDPERHRLLLLDAAVRWLEALSADHQLVVVLDDLQWADPSTLDLLDHLIATPLNARLLVVATYRHDELDDEQRARIATLVSRAEHVHIGGLAVDEVEHLIATITDAETAAELAPELHRRTGGHPLFVSELARLSDLGTGGALPTAVTEAVARRLQTLPKPTRDLLDAGCVLGNRLLVDVLATVTGLRPPEVIQSLEAACDAGIVRADSGTELWFVHDLFRETLYTELSASRRIALHGEIGSALEARLERGAIVSPSDIARHLTLAVGLGETEPAIRWAREAATEERRRSAFTEAAAHLRRVRTAAADAGWPLDPMALVPLLVDEADDVARSGDPDEARALLAQAAASARTAELEADVALAVQGLGAKFASRRDEIIAQLESAVAAIGDSDPIREARLTAALARELQHSVAEERMRAGPLSERALELGRVSNDGETLIACLLARHDALWTPGTGAARAELGHEIADVATRLGSSDHVGVGLVLEANGLLESGSPVFRPVLDRWFALMEERDQLHDRYMVLTRRAALALIEGEKKDAETLMQDAAVIGEQIHEPDTGNVLMSQRVALSQAMDDPDELRAVAEDAVSWWTGAPVLAHAVAAGAYAAAGDLDDARREVAFVAAAGGWQSEGSYLRSVLVGHLAEAAAVLGDLPLCQALFEEIVPLAGSCGVNGAVVAFAGPFAYPAGILAATLGQTERAVSLIEESIATASELGASGWVKRGEEALLLLGASTSDPASCSDPDTAHFRRTGRVWTVAFAGECGTLKHLAGIDDLARLVGDPGSEISATDLIGGREFFAADGSPIRPGEVAAGRLNDAIDRLDAVVPALAAHLRRTLTMDDACGYRPAADDLVVHWRVDD